MDGANVHASRTTRLSTLGISPRDSGMLDDVPSPHFHPLNQAAEMILKNFDAPMRSADKMALIQLALLTLERHPPSPKHAEHVAALQRWDLPRWQNLALLMLEKQLTPQRLLMLSAADAGSLIAETLVDLGAP